MLRRILSAIGIAIVASSVVASPALAKKRVLPPPAVTAVIDVSSQSMSVKVNGWYYGSWRVSTARQGYHTPRGKFRAQRTARVYYSKKYDNAPMPNSVFFHHGYAIHATNYVRKLGRPASHGCVRLSPGDAADFYELVQEYGLRSTRITIVD
jgi:lipoprotein-anchoring transpeptidase ErfK/SrfK